MLHRKELKRRAKHNLKKHYLLFVALCLIAAFIGSEFSSSLSIIHSATLESTGTHAEDSMDTGPEEGLADVILHIISGIWKKAMPRPPDLPSIWSPSQKKIKQPSSDGAGAYFPCSLTASLPVLFSSELPWGYNLCFSLRASL